MRQYGRFVIKAQLSGETRCATIAEETLSPQAQYKLSARERRSFKWRIGLGCELIGSSWILSDPDRCDSPGCGAQLCLHRSYQGAHLERRHQWRDCRSNHGCDDAYGGQNGCNGPIRGHASPSNTGLAGDGRDGACGTCNGNNVVTMIGSGLCFFIFSYYCIRCSKE